MGLVHHHLTIGKWEAFRIWLHSKGFDKILESEQTVEGMLSHLFKLTAHNVQIVETLVPIIFRKTWKFPLWWLWKRVTIGKVPHYAHYLSASEVADALNAFRLGVVKAYDGNSKRAMAHRLRRSEPSAKIGKLSLDTNLLRQSLVPQMARLVESGYAQVATHDDCPNAWHKWTTKSASDILLSHALFYSALQGHENYIEAELMK